LVRQLRDAAECSILTTVTDLSCQRMMGKTGSRFFAVRVDPASAWSKLRAAARIVKIMLAERRRYSILHFARVLAKTMLAIVCVDLQRIASNSRPVGTTTRVDESARAFSVLVLARAQCSRRESRFSGPLRAIGNAGVAIRLIQGWNSTAFCGGSGGT